MVVWLIGLSGAGKTTLASKIVSDCRKLTSSVVLVDGDLVRAIFGNDLGYTLGDRQQNANRICQLCKFLDDQGIHVVCAILSLFPESREWNRNNLKSYYEVFIDAPLSDMKSRDIKGIYARYERGVEKNVAGLDLEFKAPNSNLVIQNNGSLEELLEHSREIVNKMLGIC